MMKRVLITGAAGFLGSHLCDRLINDGNQVVAMDNLSTGKLSNLEHLFPNKSWFDLRKKDMPRSVVGLGDHQLLIKLSGIKELAKLRGFLDVSYDIVKCE